jgi:hypothetical protein
MIRDSRSISVRFALIGGLAVTIAGSSGCERPLEQASSAANDLPPAYTRDKIIDPKIAKVAAEFRAWVVEQKAGDAPMFFRLEILPPAPTLLPYGVGTYEKQLRLPAILTTGPGWRALEQEHRENLTRLAFEELDRLLKASGGESVPRPTLTIQTPQGLELAWINDLEPGRILLHGEDQ